MFSVLGRAPYGYRYVGREAGHGAARFEVIEKAAVIRRIFCWVGEERVSLTTICQRLLETGVPSPTGNARRNRSTVWVLLLNPAYASQAQFGKVVSSPWRPPLRPARGRAPIPKDPSRRVPAPPESRIAIPIPALIDATLFEGVQKQLEESRQRHRSAGRARAVCCRVCWSANLAVTRFALVEGAAAFTRTPIPRLSLHWRGQEPPQRPASVRGLAHSRRAARCGDVGRGLPAAERPPARADLSWRQSSASSPSYVAASAD